MQLQSGGIAVPPVSLGWTVTEVAAPPSDPFMDEWLTAYKGHQPILSLLTPKLSSLAHS